MKTISSLGLLAALFLASCKDSSTTNKPAEDEEIKALREKIAALNSELESGEGDRAMLVAKYDVAIDSLKSSVEELDSKLKTVQSEKPVEAIKVEAVPKEETKAEKEVEVSETDINAIRSAAVGETHEKLELSMGRVYYKVRITGVDEIGVKFSHRDGAARIDFLNLPYAWKERFHFNIAKFLEARKAERVARYNWEKAVDERIAKIRAKKREAEDKERIAELELALAKAKRPVNVTQAASTEVRRTSRSPFDEYSSVVYPYYESGSSSSSYCPPVIPVSRPRVSVPTYRPPVSPTPVTRPPVVRSAPSRPTPVVRPRFKAD